MGAIEAGRAVPGVDVAMRIARTLECSVEELFGGASEHAVLATEAADARATGRVTLAHLGGRWVSHALSAEGGLVCADGVVVTDEARTRRVELVRTEDEARENVVVMGCAMGLGLLSDRLNARRGPGRFVWLTRSSAAAVKALGRGLVHVAGVHLVDARTGEANVPDVRRATTDEPIVLVTLARWEEGLLLRPEDTDTIRKIEDLGRPGLRVVGRETGAGAQRLLEREVRAAGLSPNLARRPHLRAGSHLDVARAIAMGAADTGVATRDAAMTFGLSFVPLAEERYDLAMTRPSLEDPRLARLLDVVVSGGFRRELEALGYDARTSGTRVTEVRAS